MNDEQVLIKIKGRCFYDRGGLWMLLDKIGHLCGVDCIRDNKLRTANAGADNNDKKQSPNQKSTLRGTDKQHKHKHNVHNILGGVYLKWKGFCTYFFFSIFFKLWFDPSFLGLGAAFP